MDDYNFKVAIMDNKIIMKLQKQCDNVLGVFYYEFVENFTSISSLTIPVLYFTLHHYQTTHN